MNTRSYTALGILKMEIINNTKSVELSNGCIINKTTYQQLRKRYSMQRIAQDFGVSFEELIDRLDIALALELDPETKEHPEFQVGETVLLNCKIISGQLIVKAVVDSILPTGLNVKLLEKAQGLNKGHLIGVSFREVERL